MGVVGIVAVILYLSSYFRRPQRPVAEEQQVNQT